MSKYLAFAFMLLVGSSAIAQVGPVGPYPPSGNVFRSTGPRSAPAGIPPAPPNSCMMVIAGIWQAGPCPSGPATGNRLLIGNGSALLIGNGSALLISN